MPSPVTAQAGPPLPPPEREVLQRAFELWGAEASCPELLGGSNCWVYALDRADGKRVLRLTPDTGPSRTGQVRAELDWLCYLARRDAPVCAPSTSLQGRLVERLGGEHDGGVYLVSAFQRARGKPVYSSHPEVWTPELFEICGRTLGELHALSKDFVPDPDARREGWSAPGLVALARQALPLAERGALSTLERCCERISELSCGRDDYGLIHGDFHQGNYWLNGHRLEVFDFDGCAYCWFGFDIAISLLASLLDHVDRGERRLEGHARAYFSHFMRGYVRENRLASAWAERLGDFLQVFNLLIFVSFFRSSKRPAGKLFDFVSEHARSGEPCINLDFSRLYEEIA
ncbi:MAG TPA: phosphotransferase [Thermoanaerobaculia bacterium]|jgi:Ser/Thr protein kinase RdoA (MazF antagonist)